MKNPAIKIIDHRQAYHFRKAVMKGDNKEWKRRIKNISNRSLSYALTFGNRLN